MSYETQPGYPYAPRFRILSGAGAPVTTGIVATMTVKGPTGTTLTSGAVTHLGDGYWGLSVPGASLTALGTYTWATGAITGTATLAAQAGTFVVGVGDLLTLRELYTSVRRAVRDGWTGTATTAGTATTLRAARFAWGSANNWLDSELYFFNPSNVTDLNPVRVTGFDQTTGTFTFANQAIALATTAVGAEFIVGNKENSGFGHDEVLDAILTTLRRMRVLRAVTDQVSVTTAYNTFEYPIPNWVALDGVEYQELGYSTTRWQKLPPTYYRHVADRGVLRLDLPMLNNAVRITGRAIPALPATMGELVQADGATVRDDALYELLSMSDDQGDRQRAAMLGPGITRARAGATLARL